MTLPLQVPVPRGGHLEPNGDLTFPCKGKPLKAIQGFVRDKGDPFLWHPILKPCIHRKVKYLFYEKCKCTGETVHCELFDTINLSKCIGCQHAIPEKSN